MKRPLSFVIRAGGARDALERSLPPLLEELERRGAGDELLLVEDALAPELEGWVATRFPPPATFERARTEIRVLRLPRVAGQAAALRAGCEEATHELVFLMDARLAVEAGFLEPLVEALSDAQVCAALPWLEPARGPQHERAAWHAGELLLEAAPIAPPAAELELDFLSCAAALVRRDEFLASGFDALFEPEAWLEREWSWSLRRAGRRLVCVPSSRATLAEAAREADATQRILAERGRLLCTWKHLDDERLWREHRAALLARITQAVARGERETLLGLALALDDLAALARVRPAGAARRSFASLARAPASASAAASASATQAPQHDA